jgi:hypothetical protein
LSDELDEMREAAKAQSWQGDADAVDLGDFDAVVAFGSDPTLARIAEGIAKRSRFIGYGAKASIGYIGRDALSDEAAARSIADGAARDVVLYETEGCLSLHALFVERGGNIEPQQFSSLLAAAVERAAVEFPPGVRDARASARIATARNLAAFRSAGGSGSVFSDEHASYLAVLDPPGNEPPAYLPRALAIHTVNAPTDAAEYLTRHSVPIEAVAVAGPRPDIEAMIFELGASRIAAFGDLQRPPATANHGGRPRIADYVRFVSNEL